MWLARLFGRRSDDSEPSEFPPHPASSGSAPQTATRSASTSAAPVARTSTLAQAGGPASKGNGFDPYNSGAFRKSSAWERVSRR